MAAKAPYQPSLLRLLHAGTAISVITIWLSALLIYGHYVGGWFNPAWIPSIDLFSIHQALAKILLPLAAALILYTFTIGSWRLRQPANAAILLILSVPCLSGIGMHRHWLEDHQLHHWVYHLHLLGWILVALGLGWHVLSALRRGGIVLISSMLDVKLKSNDHPSDWPGQIKTWFKHRH